MASLRIVLRRDKIRKDGTAPLYIRLIHLRKIRYTSLGVKILPQHWQDEKQRVNSSHPFSARLNNFLAKKRAEFEEIAFKLQEEGGRLDRSLKGILNGEAGRSYFEYASTQIQRLENQSRFSTADSYRSALRQFRQWFAARYKREDLSFADFSLQIARDFKNYLETQLGNHPNTIRSKFVVLRRMMNLAHKEGIISEKHNALGKIDTPRRKSTKVIPTPEEIAQIEALELEPDTRKWHTRNLFLFCCRMAGMRFADAITLRWSNLQGEHLHWQTRKTQTALRLFLPAQAAVLIQPYQNDETDSDQYIFPFLDSQSGTTGRNLHSRIRSINSHCNDDLKQIIELAGLSRPFTFHSSRHYFATESLRRGMRVEVLRKIMTHASIQQTLEYVHIANADMDAAMRL